jgi:hypothetical protein
MKIHVFTLFLGLLLPAVVFGKPYKEINPQWADKSNVIRINAQQTWYWYQEFSRDSKYYAVWNHENKPPYDFSNFPYIGVWDLNGNQITDAIDNSKLFMTPIYRSLFDKCALREAPYSEYNNSEYSKFTPYSNIANDAMGWFISPDWKYMVTFKNPKWSKEQKTNSSASRPDFDTSTMDMWQLEPVTNKIWENTYKGSYIPRMGCFYSKGGSVYLLLVDFRDVRIYSCSDGKLVHSLSLFIETPEKELQNRIKQFHLQNWCSARDVEFEPMEMAFSPERELVACQDQTSKRFRVFSTKPGSGLVYKGNENESPKSKSSLLYASGPWGYTGASDRIQFGGGGKYLLVSFMLGTRAMFRPIPQQLVTEIYDTDTWKLIWQKNTEHIRNISISNDGMKVALMRDNVLEIGDIESFLKGYNK